LKKCSHKFKKIETWVFIYGNEITFFQNPFVVNGLPLRVFFRGNNVFFFWDLFNGNELPILVNGVNERQILIII
jgi:hypothetical protein